MGRKLKNILDPQTISTITIYGVGQISPNRHNDENTSCSMCKGELLARSGFAFRSKRGRKNKSGFVCQVCVANVLASVEDWFFNRHFELLQPAVEDHRVVDGGELAKVWIQGGIDRLFQRVYPQVQQ